MRPLTLGWLTLLEAPPADVVRAAAAAKFDAVSLRITGRTPDDPHPTVVGDAGALRALKSELDASGLPLTSASIYHLYPAIGLDQVLPALEASAALGARAVVVTCMDPDEARWTAFVAACCDRAADFGLWLALEFTPYSEARTLEQGARIVRNAAQPNFGLLVDSLHLARSGGKPSDLSDLKGGEVVFAQLCDAAAKTPTGMDLAAESRRGRRYPGDGALPLADFMKALPAGTVIEIETPRADVAHLPLAEQASHAADAARRFLGSLEDPG
ncbi:MAG: sugar phosphate isomerase/epimerase [Alphaproteobacteria bacterium]|jgi:sugar phosphate isomerase/epimerase